MGVKTFVDSVAYNMAGDEKNRPQYLKGLVIQNVLSNSKNGMGEAIKNGYLYGPAIGLRNFFNWADKNYGAIGMPIGTLTGQQNISLNIIAEAIPHGSNESVWVQEAESGYADYFWWAKQYMFENHPDIALDDTWTADIDDEFNILITFEDESTEVFTINDFNNESSYIYAYYSIIKENEEGPLIEGITHNIGQSEDFPSIVGWNLNQDTNENINIILNTTTNILKEYSDSRPDEESTDSVDTPTNYDFNTKVYIREINQGTNNNSLIKRVEYMNQWRNKQKDIVETITTTEEDIGGGVIMTTTTIVTEEILINNNSYRADHREVVAKEWSPSRIFIYRIGSGNEDLDNSIVYIENYGKFFPNIPVRLNNQFLSNDFEPEAYKLAKKAYKRSMDGKFDALIADLEDNEDLEDIDFAFIVFGVSLNVVENSAKKYIYFLLNELRQVQIGGPTVYEDYLQKKQEAYEKSEEWQEWYHNQKPGNPQFGQPEPNVETVPNPLRTVNRIRVNNQGPLNTDYDVRIEWAYMQETFADGLGKPNAKLDEVWITNQGFDEYEISRNIDPSAYDGPPPPKQVVKIEKTRIWWQYEKDKYKYIDCLGLVHHNHVYAGKSVVITAHAALADEDESGFIVPLQNAAFRNMRLVDSTQMVTACCFIIFNCYVQKKQKWYQKGIFKILLVVVVAALTAVTGGIAGVGLLGVNFSIGVSLGFSGMTAVIVGAVANALAAIALATVIEVAAKAIFGSALGGIIASILTFFITAGIGNLHQTGSLALNWGNLMKADVIMKVMDSIGRGYTEYVMADIQSMQKSLDQFMKDSEEQLDRIRKQYYEEFGYGSSIIDPMMLVDSSKLVIESGDTFLTRTLMTGSDIADMSLTMLNDFAELTLTLPNAYA